MNPSPVDQFSVIHCTRYPILIFAFSPLLSQHGLTGKSAGTTLSVVFCFLFPAFAIRHHEPNRIDKGR